MGTFVSAILWYMISLLEPLLWGSGASILKLCWTYVGIRYFYLLFLYLTWDYLSSLIGFTTVLAVQINWLHCVKSVRIQSFSGPYFPTLGLYTDNKNSEFSPNVGKYEPEKLRIQTLFTQCSFPYKCNIGQTCVEKIYFGNMLFLKCLVPTKTSHRFVKVCVTF